jgi:hypothetical protein
MNQPNPIFTLLPTKARVNLALAYGSTKFLLAKNNPAQISRLASLRFRAAGERGFHCENSR